MPRETMAYQYIERTPHLEACKRNIHVKNEDCLVVARAIQAEHASVCVLNMANQVNVGGDYLTLCALAQEESLIKRTNLLDALIHLDGVKRTNNPSNPHQYALSDCLGFNYEDQHMGFGEFTCLYSPDITVSYLDHALEQPLEHPFTVNIISSAAYNLANLPETFNQELYAAGTVLKIMNQLRTAKAHHQRHLVLGAFGCGAFGNDPDFIARIYRSSIDELEFVGCFDSISFAVTQKKSAGNYDVFHQVFNDNTLSIPSTPLFNTLLPAFESFEKHSILKKMIMPFFKIKTTEELVYLASRLIQKNIYALHATPYSRKKEFLHSLLEQLSERPESADDILNDALASPDMQVHFPSSKFFKTKPVFLSELRRLLLWHDTAELATELFSDDTAYGSEQDTITHLKGAT